MADTLSIHDLAPLGDGVHVSERGRIYVERTLPGDVVSVKTARTMGGVQRAELVSVLEGSPDRIAAPCKHYDVCGGCTLQHATETFYRKWKVEAVRSSLRKQGIVPAAWHAPIFLPAASRRRVTFAALKKRNTVSLGFFDADLMS